MYLAKKQINLDEFADDDNIDYVKEYDFPKPSEKPERRRSSLTMKEETSSQPRKSSIREDFMDQMQKRLSGMTSDLYQQL